MSYQSVNELEQFSFEDCKITGLSFGESNIRLEVEALIVKPSNSQNSNYTESYAGPAVILLEGGRLTGGFREGYKYYDANEVLIREVEDEPAAVDEIRAMEKTFVDAWLFAMEKKSASEDGFVYVLAIEMPEKEDAPDAVTDSWQLEVRFDRAVVSWEFYENRVQR
jgi:hypothetical protein